MGATGHLARLRECVGHHPLLAPAAAACIRDEEVRILLPRHGPSGNTVQISRSEAVALPRSGVQLPPN